MAKTISTKTRTGKELKIDPTELQEIQSRAKDLESRDSQLVQMYKDLDEMYLMTWGGDSGKKWQDPKTQLTISPDARNTALGAVRLMVATDPIFNVVNDDIEQTEKERLESAINQMFYLAGRAANNPIHYDALLSSVLYATIHCAFTSTDDLVAAAKDNQKGQARAEMMAAKTPYLIDVWNPKDGHPDSDTLGLNAFYRKVETTAGKIVSDYGASNCPDAVVNAQKYQKMDLNIFYDLDFTTVWVDAGVILHREHGLPCIPVMVQQTEGTKLFSKPEESFQPLLYTLLKSGLWKMENLIYTVMYTLIKDMGVTPLYKHKAPKSDPNKELDIDYDQTPGVVHVVEDEDFIPLVNKGLMDPTVADGLKIAEQKAQESTLYSQALGAPVAGNNTFSTLALLSQSGRLPLIGTTKRGGWGLSGIMEQALIMFKADARTYKSGGLKLKASEIPDGLMLECKVDVKLPQDKLQQANIASMITSGDDPLASKEWARDNVLGISKSGEMQKDIWSEQTSTFLFTQYLSQQAEQAKQAQAQAAMQQTQNQQAQGQQAQSQSGMPQMPGGGQPQQEPLQPNQAAVPSMAPDQATNIQGMPAQMGGMIPGEGLAVNGGSQ